MNSNKKGELLRVVGLDKRLVAYNPFPIGENIIALRVESADSDYLNLINKIEGPYDPRIQFFLVKSKRLSVIKDSPIFQDLEDPFGALITLKDKRMLMLGGVKFSIDNNPLIETKLYLATDIFNLEPKKPYAVIKGMKDIRFCQLKEGNIAVLTRPTTGKAYPGKIGFSKINGEELTSQDRLLKKVEEAKLLKFSIDDENIKLGGNAIYSRIIKTPDGKMKEILHLICHAATADPYRNEKGGVVENDFNYGVLHYKGYVGIIDPENLDETIDLKLVVDSSDFNLSPNDVKGPRFKDVVFPGGVMGKYLYCGVGDRSIGRIKM